MTLKNNITIDDTINFLNELLKIDSEAIINLVEYRVLCNDELSDHPTVQVSYDKTHGYCKVGLMGIINGLFGTDEDGWGAICINIQDGKIINFARVEEYDKQE